MAKPKRMQEGVARTTKEVRGDKALRALLERNGYDVDKHVFLLMLDLGNGNSILRFISEERHLIDLKINGFGPAAEITATNTRNLAGDGWNDLGEIATHRVEVGFDQMAFEQARRLRQKFPRV